MAVQAGPAPAEPKDYSMLIGAVGAVGGAVALVYGIGGVVLGFRYDGLGLSAQALSVTAREQLVVRGGVAMVLWAALGLVLVAALMALRRRVVQRAGEPDKTWAQARLAIRVVTACVGLVVLLTARVWWPLVAVGAVVIIVETMRLRGAARLAVCAVAVAAVAAAYESDRLRYIVEEARVHYNDPRGSVPGILIGQTDRGFYVARLARRGGSSELVFVPAARVRKARIVKEPVDVIAAERSARRAPILDRLRGLDLR